TKPSLIIKGGMIAMAPMGDPNASIPTPQPVHYRPMFGSLGAASQSTSMIFLPTVAANNGLAEKLQLGSLVGYVKGCRALTKSSMIHNDWQPNIEVDPQTYVVKADGVALSCEPATELPMAQRYFLF
ncbi:MAG: urease subunit alpha, partial [Gammaproteobacteria bacterium]|nr:urease subunit alpha [Gammaproteobacteria bacterium]